MAFNSEDLLSTFYSFLLTCLILALNISIGIGLELYNRNSLIKSINSSDYFKQTYEEIMENTENILSQDGFPATLLSEVITMEKLHISGMKYVEDVLNNRETNLGQGIRDEIIYSLKEYAVENYITDTGDVSEEILKVSKAVENEYSNRIKMRIVDYLTECSKTYNRAIKILVPLIIALIIIISYLLIKMQYYKHRGVRYISYALLVSSLLTLIIALYNLFIKGSGNVLVQADNYYEITRSNLKLNFKELFYFGLAGFVASMISFLMVDIMKKRFIRT